jgi:hypothetical protein
MWEDRQDKADKKQLTKQATLAQAEETERGVL